jgi:hypothetical protein
MMSLEKFFKCGGKKIRMSGIQQEKPLALQWRLGTE